MPRTGENPERARCPAQVSSRAGRLAAIDVGSNTILLTVAEPDPDQGLRIVEEAEDQPRLGAGLGDSGPPADDAMQRALQTLTRMRDTCRRLNAPPIAAVATAAVREAGNGEEFADRVRELGIPLCIISPEVEAALAYRSAAYRFGPESRMLVADIGGSSLELIGAAAGTVRVALSLPLGAVRLTEQGMSHHDLREHIRQTLTAALSREELRDTRVIGSGGSFATLASMALAQPERKAGRNTWDIDHYTRGRAPAGRLAEMSLEDRQKVPGLPLERADIIVAGLTVVAELLGVLRPGSVTVSGFGLRDGLLLEMSGAA